MLRLILLLCFLCYSPSQALAQNPNIYGNGPNGHTANQVMVGSGSTSFTLVAPASTVTIANNSGQTVYFSPLSPAVTSGQGSFPIYSGYAWSYVGVPLTTIYLIAASSVTVGVDAH